MPPGDESRPDTRKPESTGENATARRRSGPRRIALPYTVEPHDERRGFLPWIDRLRRDAKSGGLGLFASLIVHAMAMVILGLIVFQTRHVTDGDPLLMTAPDGSVSVANSILYDPKAAAAARAKFRKLSERPSITF